MPKPFDRRHFLKTAGCAVAVGPALLAAPRAFAAETIPDDKDSLFLIGPRPNSPPLMSTLISMMAYMREMVLHSVKGLSQADLDFLLDGKANTIGAMLMHLAATETYYGLHTFNGMKWGTFPSAAKEKWDVPMNLGEPARKTIKGHPLDYYLQALSESRAHTLAELKKRDDKWLLTVEKDEGGAANYFWMWFHVCEHESNHNGQIKLVKGRLPGKAGKGGE
jgi:hypothetical protein